MSLADLRVAFHDRVVVANLEGEIDMSNARRLGESIADQVTNEAIGLAIDLTDVRYIDSAGIQVIYELNDRLQSRGQQLRLVVRPDSVIARTLDLVDASSTIGIVDATETAVSAMTSSGEERS
jgi:anti-sigma B factor antagonist